MDISFSPLLTILPRPNGDQGGVDLRGKEIFSALKCKFEGLVGELAIGGLYGPIRSIYTQTQSISNIQIHYHWV